MLIFIALLVVLIIGAFAYSAFTAKRVEARLPPLGTFVDIGGYLMHAVHVPGPEEPQMPPLVFLHGASSNLRDLMTVFRPAFAGRAEMLFIDRPGHGWSERGGERNNTPDGQAAAIAETMKAFGIDRAIVVGHSFGGGVTASFALFHPQMTAGLVFLSPAAYPWPGGVAWYNHVATTPGLGWLFTRTVAVPVTRLLLEEGVACVFAPNPVPEGYIEHAGIPLLMRPRTFHANAADIFHLKSYVTRIAPRYREIEAPTVIVTGRDDEIVLPEIHSEGLKRDIADAELVWVDNLGHKPDYVVTELAVAAIEQVAGQPRDLQLLARRMEARIADDEASCGGAESAPTAEPAPG